MALLPEMMASDWGKSEDPKDAPMLRAYGAENATFYEWMASPGNETRHARFGAAMIAYGQQVSPDDITSGKSVCVEITLLTEW
jgi:hypothetical protein